MSLGAPIEKGTPIRYPSTALVLVDSQDQKSYDPNGYRIDSTKPTRIYINKQRPMATGYMTRLALTEMNIVWDVYNVNQSNSTLTFAVYTATDATPPVVALNSYQRIDLITGYYTPDSLATAVATAMNAVVGPLGLGLTFTCTYDDDDCTFRINQTGTHPSGRTIGYWKLVSSSAPETLTGEEALNDDLTYLMGLEPVTGPGAEPTGFYTTLQGAFAPMTYTPYIDVISNLLTKNQNVADGTSKTLVTSSKLARIYLSNEQIINQNQALESGGDVVYPTNIVGVKPTIFRREFKFPKQIQWNTTENIDVIDIEVLDHRGNPILLEDKWTTTVPNPNNLITTTQSQNTQFEFTLQVTEV